MYEKVPNELKKLSQWGYYHRIWNDEKGKYNKIPKNPYNGGDGKTNDQSTWSDFDTAMQALKTYPDADGLAFYFANGYVGLDIDHIAEDLNNAKSGDTNPNNLVNKARELTHGSYMETSMSGEGIHVIFKGEILGKRRRKGNYEMYQSGRFFALTGNSLMAEPEIKSLNSHDMQILYEHYFHDGKAAGPTQKQVEPVAANNLSDDEIIERAENASNGERFKSFMDGGWESSYSSHSEADMAFANDLAFWCGRDFNQMDRIFRQSALYRKKYDEKRGKSTYGIDLLNKAINETTSVFNPHQPLNLNYDMSFLQNNGDADDKKQPTNMADLFHNLKSLGENWREEHIEEKNQKDGTVRTIIHRVPPRTAANFLKEQATFAIIGENSRDLDKAPLTYYDLDKGIYIKSDRAIERMINAVDNEISRRGRNEIIGWLTLESKQARPEKNPYLVPVGNGVVNTKNNKLLPFSPSFIFTGKVATNYNPDAAEPSFNGWTFSHWVDEIADGNREKTTLIWQMIASVVQNRRTSNVFFGLVDGGDGRTGKSTFEQLLINLVGEDNSAALMMDQFSNDFLLAQAYGATLIIGDDNEPKGYIENSSNLKSVVTNESVLVNPKGLTPFTARFYCTIIQSMNGVPRFKDTSGGLYRRFRMIKFNHKYDETKENRRIKHEYIYNPRLLEWILKTALTVNIDTIINTEENKSIVHEVRLDNDPVLSFYENYVPQLKSTRIPVKFLFNYFMSAMDAENNHQQMKQNTFTKQIRPLFKKDGWTYSLKNLAPLAYFDADDKNLIIDNNRGTGVAYGYLADIDPSKTQPLFYKTDKTIKNRQKN